MDAKVRDRSAAQPYRPYEFHSREPVLPVTVELPSATRRDIARIDAWLDVAFAVAPTRLENDIHPPRDDARDALATALGERAALLFGELLRASGFPSFAAGRVLSVRPLPHRPDDREALLLLPVLDNVPVAIFQRLIRGVVKLLGTSLTKEPAPLLVRNVLAEIKQTVVDRLEQALKFNSSSLAICRLAYDNDIPYRHVGNGFFLIGSGAKAALSRGSAVGRDSALGGQICGYKQITAGILRAAGLPAPRHFVVASHQEAAAAARELGWPVVVKPSNRERSEGVTANLTDDRALAAAYDLAASPGAQVLVERQVPGVCHRVMVADGKLVYCVVRYAKSVVGNGTDTVAALAAAENARWAAKPPWKRLKVVPLDEAALACLADQGLTLECVPEEGRRVLMRPITSGEWGGDIADLTETVHPDNVALAVTAAKLLGLTVAGIDLMTTDAAVPWHENGAAIIEVNFDPQFFLHRADLAGRVLSALVAGDGRIPVHLVTGSGDLIARARALRGELGLPAFIVSAAHGEDPAGAPVILPPGRLLERSLALALRRDVEALIIVGAAAEVLEQGLAVDRLAGLDVVTDDAATRERIAAELKARFRIG